MLKRQLYFVVGVILAVATSNSVSAAEDNPDSKRCGGYYACIELLPAQPGSLSVWSVAFSTSTSP